MMMVVVVVVLRFANRNTCHCLPTHPLYASFVSFYVATEKVQWSFQMQLKLSVYLISE